ncbi:MAG: hypothetical protein MUO21_00085, partial [Nitrososphaeraceae archaeon]|nr:hypothetical protein [Nitrososphaeraceae archaeon]
VEPFWKPGTKLIPKKKPVDILDKVYTSEECLICMTEDLKPSVLLVPCNHCCMCVKCYQKTNKCPICRNTVINAIPF